MKDIFNIDPNCLDVEWVGQPKLFYKHAEKLADARLELATSKAELDVVAAELDQEIRNDPAVFGLDKVTETTVRTAITLNKRHRSKLKAFNNNKHTVDLLQSVISALDHRKAALENMVRLHGQNYFSTPQATTEDAQEAKKEMGVSRKKTSRKKLKRKQP